MNLIALVRRVLDPGEPRVLYFDKVSERYEWWLGEHSRKGVVFTEEHRSRSDAIRDHIDKNPRIEEEDIDHAPINAFCGPWRVHDLFGERLSVILDELTGNIGRQEFLPVLAFRTRLKSGARPRAASGRGPPPEDLLCATLSNAGPT